MAVRGSSYNPYKPRGAPSPGAAAGARPRLRFGLLEIGHLSLAVLVLTIAFFFVIRANKASGLPPWLLLGASFLAVASGFILHELAHKFLAQRYGHWAEFRAHFAGLLLTFAVVLATTVLIPENPILFAAPGAVLIYGHVTARENGLISLLGPATNLAICAVTLPFSIAVTPNAFQQMMGVIAIINASLGLFNLIPVGPLDGRKVWNWNKPVFFVSFALAFAALLLAIGVIRVV